MKNREGALGIKFQDLNFILRYCFNIDAYQYLNGSASLTLMQKKSLQNIVEKYKSGYPLEYIAGVSNFFGLELDVNPDVLAPRPETEILVERVLEEAGNQPGLKILDIGTGSGNICTAIGLYNPLAKIYSVDISRPALSVAQKNVRKYGLKNVFLVNSSLFGCFKPGSFDIIAGNPPYVESSYLKTCKFLRSEPREALDGGRDGLNYIRIIIKSAEVYLQNNGLLLIEIGYNHSKLITGMIGGSGLELSSVIKDYAGIDRFMVCKKRQ